MLTQFVGAPCGHHGQYTFYKAFKFYKHGKYKILTVGEFFFVRISPSDDPCIGELQLLWEDKGTDQVLSSMRLYFLPEQTPDGRHPHHGEHEVIAVTEKVILRLEDLVHWITEQVEWSHGLPATCQEDVKCPSGGVAVGLDSIPGLEGVEPSKADELSRTCFEKSAHTDTTDGHKERRQPVCHARRRHIDGRDNVCRRRRNSLRGASEKSCHTSVLVLSYPRYCRYRAVLQRLRGVEDSWLRSAIVVAVGGFTLHTRNTRILFCRESFDHEGLLQNDLNCDHLAPNLKSKPKKLAVSNNNSTSINQKLQPQQPQQQPQQLPQPKKEKVQQGRSLSPDAEESNASDEIKETNAKVHLEETKNGRKPMCKDEQEFLQLLFKFMQERNTPIHRVPHLGFKQIDLYFFYKYAQKLGGYEKITCKKLWKHIYDEMGGNPGSTSAATCTRRHYERLLLPYERHRNGQEDKPLPMVPPPRNRTKKSEDPSGVKLESMDGEEEDMEKQESAEEDSGGVGETMEPVVASVKKEPEQVSDSLPQVPPTPLDPTNMAESISEKESNWTEKEKRWNEIRRKNALERNWARQMRPVKVTTSVPEKEIVNPAPELQPPKLYSLAAIQSSLQAKMSNKVKSEGPYRSQSFNKYPVPLSSYLSSKRSAFPIQQDTTRPWADNGVGHPVPNGLTRPTDCHNDSLAQPRPSVIQHTEKMQSSPLPAHTSNKMAELHRLQNFHRQPFGNKISDYGRALARKVPSGLAFPKNGMHRLDEQLPFCRKMSVSPLPPEGSQVARRQTDPYYFTPAVQVYPDDKGRPTKVQFEYPKSCNSPRGPTASSFPSALAPSTPSYSKRVCPPSPCEAEVLDLSTKRKATTSGETNGQLTKSPQRINSEVECLDLTVKKRKVVIDLSDEARGIENVTPPSPISQEPSLLPPIKSPPITSLSLLRSATASDKRVYKESSPPALIPLVDARPPFIEAGGHSKSPYVSEYNPPLPHFVAPHMYPTPQSLWQGNHAMAQESLQASLSAYKEMVDRGMFPGQLQYSFAPQMYPTMYKDGHAFPSYSK